MTTAAGLRAAASLNRSFARWAYRAARDQASQGNGRAAELLRARAREANGWAREYDARAGRVQL